MDEQLLRDAAHDYAVTLLAIARTFKKRADFYEHCANRYSLSKTRAALLCHFAEFNAMCREAEVTRPDHPENVAPILSLPKKQWLDAWEIVCSMQQWKDLNAKNVKACMDRMGIAPKRTPKHIIERMKIQRAAKTFAEIDDGQKLANVLGPKGFGRNWDGAVHNVIEADQARMDLESQLAERRKKLGV